MEMILSVIEFILAGIVLYGAVAGIIFLLRIVAYWRLFTKAGEPGWKSIIPVYNIAVQYKISWSTGAFWIMAAAALAQGILEPKVEASTAAGRAMAVLAVLIGLIHIISSFKLAKSFGRGFFFGLGLCVFPTLFMLILGLGDSAYVGPNGVPKKFVAQSMR